MEYRGYRIKEDTNRIIIENIRDFHPVHIFECGQCFRWAKEADESYTGVAAGRVLNVKAADGRLELINTNVDDFVNIWFDYFDLGRDYGLIKEVLSKDPIMREAIRFGYGIRLLRQDIWETLISFIISSNNRIPKIIKTINNISQAYGDERTFDGRVFYSFPQVQNLAAAGTESLEACKAGYRCKYIVNTSRMVWDNKVNIHAFQTMTTQSARDELTKFSGVGNKVADCVLLYSGTRYDVFPTDVWVKRVMEELYFKREAGFKEIQDFAGQYFGEFAGFAQQYLFYYAREKKIGV